MSLGRAVFVEPSSCVVHLANTLCANKGGFRGRVGHSADPTMLEKVRDPPKVARVDSLGIEVQKIFYHSGIVGHAETIENARTWYPNRR